MEDAEMLDRPDSPTVVPGHEHGSVTAESLASVLQVDDEPHPVQCSALVRRLLALLTSACKKRPAEWAELVALCNAVHSLSDLSRTGAARPPSGFASIHQPSEENVKIIVAEGGIGAVVPLLSTFQQAEPSYRECVAASIGVEEIDEEACFLLGLLAIEPEYQHAIDAQGGLRALVGLLKQHIPSRVPPGPCANVARRAAHAITNLAHENVHIKCRVRAEGGIPLLVALLESLDAKVQLAAAGALRMLAFKNQENKDLIVECRALPMLIQMLCSDDTCIQSKAVGVIGTLVHSSQHINQIVLAAGALQPPVIGLLSSKCTESQHEAALLLGQFAITTDECKARIVQMGAVPPLIAMLEQDDAQLKEVAAFALGRLAQNTDNQTCIVQAGGLRALLELLESKVWKLQYSAAFALHGLADKRICPSDILRDNGVQCLQVILQEKYGASYEAMMKLLAIK